MNGCGVLWEQIKGDSSRTTVLHNESHPFSAPHRDDETILCLERHRPTHISTTIAPTIMQFSANRESNWTAFPAICLVLMYVSDFFREHEKCSFLKPPLVLARGTPNSYLQFGHS